MSIMQGAGTLRQQVQVVRRTPATAANEMGGGALVDAPGELRWCSIRSVSGQEADQNAQNAAEITHTVWMRYRTDITKADALVYNGRKLEIEDIRDINNEHREMILFCKEQQP